MINLKSLIFAFLIGTFLLACRQNTAPVSDQQYPTKNQSDGLILEHSATEDQPIPLPTLEVNIDVPLHHYFAFMDSLLLMLDSVGGQRISEHVLVLANPWIIDSLRTTDYYYRLEQRGEFVEDPNDLIVLHRGQLITVPDSSLALQIQSRLDSMRIDVNIPEFKLRIMQSDTILYTFNVRVGRKEKKFLSMAGRVVNLETPRGEGKIIRINKNAWFINPVDGKRYFRTKRDDGQYTKLPGIPWLEPTIDGRRQGSLIHPTTNKSTLGKSVSNGCVGAAEGDMWVIYYHAPIGTRVIYRYDTQIIGPLGDTLRLKDIYGLRNRSN